MAQGCWSGLDLEYDFAELGGLLHPTERIRTFGQGKHFVDNRSDLLLFDEAKHLVEVPL